LRRRARIDTHAARGPEHEKWFGPCRPARLRQYPSRLLWHIHSTQYARLLHHPAPTATGISFRSRWCSALECSIFRSRLDSVANKRNAMVLVLLCGQSHIAKAGSHHPSAILGCRARPGITERTMVWISWHVNAMPRGDNVQVLDRRGLGIAVHRWDHW
jgi:hypothetical protein